MRTSLIIPFFIRVSVDMVEFVDPQLLLERAYFRQLQSAQNKNISKMRTENFGHGSENIHFHKLKKIQITKNP